MTRIELQGGAESSCGYHRVFLPFGRLKAQPKVPVLVFNRLVPGGVMFLRQKRAEGYRILADLDDFWELPPEHYLAAQWTAAGTPARIRACLAEADVVMVTNEHLADHVRPINPHVVIVPNALPFDEGQFTRAAPSEASTFVYAAGASHVPDVAPVAAAFDREEIVLAGYEERHAEWQRMRQLLPRASRQPSRRVTEYMGLYDGHLAALAPLAPNEFNRCKSNLKLLEAGAKGIPLLASDVAPYRSGADVRCAMLASNAGEWEANMRACRAYPWLAAEMGAALAAHVREHYHLDKVNEIRRQLVESFA